MRRLAGVFALAAAVLLAGCESAGDTDKDKASPDFATREAAAAFAATGSPFDYRYAFRLPGDRVKQILESNADACERAGESRCRILAMRYRVENRTNVTAVLTVKIDPTIARAFGDAVTDAVGRADGQLVDTEIRAGEIGTTRDKTDAEWLQEALEASEEEGGDAAQARAREIRDALAVIEDVKGGNDTSFATAPVLITYESTNGLSPLGATPEANFRNAGRTFETSLANLLQVLAGIGPWLVVLLIGVFVLRWIIHGTGGDVEPAEAGPNAVPVDDRDPDSNRNLIQRWFSRDDEE